MTNNTETFGCDKEQIIAFLSKVKKYFNQFIQCTYLDENCKPLEDCQCPDDASFVELCIGDKDPIKICLNPIKGVKIGQDENGNDVFADVTNSIADLSKCCPVAAIEIPATAFEDPENPTQGEVNTWITSNHPDAPPNTNFYYGYEDSGNPDDPDWVWSYDGNGNTINIESPECCEAIEHVQIGPNVDPLNWLANNAANYPAGTNFYLGEDPLNPEAVWENDSNGDLVCVKAPGSDVVHVQVPEGEDPAEWIGANAPEEGWPEGTNFYTGDDPLNPTGSWEIDSAGDLLCQKAPQPLHVQLGPNVDPENWLSNNAANYPPGTHFYQGDALNPSGVWTSDANFDIVCDKAPPPQHVQVPEGEEPAVWIAANASDYPPGTQFYSGDDPLNPDGVWHIDATGSVMCDKAPAGDPVSVCEGEETALYNGEALLHKGHVDQPYETPATPNGAVSDGYTSGPECGVPIVKHENLLKGPPEHNTFCDASIVGSPPFDASTIPTDGTPVTIIESALVSITNTTCRRLHGITMMQSKARLALRDRANIVVGAYASINGGAFGSFENDSYDNLDNQRVDVSMVPDNTICNIIQPGAVYTAQNRTVIVNSGPGSPVAVIPASAKALIFSTTRRT